MSLFGVYTIVLQKTGESLGLRLSDNARVESFVKSTPASRVFHIGDRILSINQDAVQTKEDVKHIYTAAPAGLVTFVVDRCSDQATNEIHSESDRYISLFASAIRTPGAKIGLGIAERECAGFKTLEIVRVEPDSIFTDSCQAGDLLVAVNGQTIVERPTLLMVLRDCGSDIMLEIARKESAHRATPIQSVKVTPAEPKPRTFEVDIAREPGKHLGLGLGTMAGKAVILSIRADSMAEGKLKINDFVRSINGQTVNSAEEAKTVFLQTSNETVIKLKIDTIDVTSGQNSPTSQNVGCSKVVATVTQTSLEEISKLRLAAMHHNNQQFQQFQSFQPPPLPVFQQHQQFQQQQAQFGQHFQYNQIGIQQHPQADNLKSIMSRPRDNTKAQKKVCVAAVAPEVIEVSFDDDIDPNKPRKKVPKRS